MILINSTIIWAAEWLCNQQNKQKYLYNQNLTNFNNNLEVCSSHVMIWLSAQWAGMDERNLVSHFLWYMWWRWCVTLLHGMCKSKMFGAWKKKNNPKLQISQRGNLENYLFQTTVAKMDCKKCPSQVSLWMHNFNFNFNFWHFFLFFLFIYHLIFSHVFLIPLFLGSCYQSLSGVSIILPGELNWRETR